MKIKNQLKNYQLSNVEHELIHVPYDIHQLFLSYIREGNMDALMQLPQNHTGYSIGKMAYSPLKQEEYKTVLAIVAISQAAVEGGVNPYDAYDMGDLYLQRVSVASKIEEYEMILADAIHDYVSAVREAKLKQTQSVHIEKCKQYVKQHLNRPFTLNDIAEELELSPNYLSAIFSQYEKTTLKEYTLIERIRAAENMLKYTDHAIGVIANYLCFCSQSHFSQVFKKYTGVSPAVYRKNNMIVTNYD